MKIQGDREVRPGVGQRNPKIPLEVLFGHPNRFAPSISPDGKYLAYPAPEDGKVYLWVRSLESGEERGLVEGEGFGIFSAVWTRDSQQLLFLQDDRGDENWHLWAVDVVTTETRDLTPFAGVKTRIVSMSPNSPTKVLIEMNREDRSLFDLYLLDIKTGDIELASKNPGGVSAMQPDRPAWFADLDLEVRARTRAHGDGSYSLEIRDAQGEWKQVRRWDLEDTRSSRPIAVSGDGSVLYCIDSFEYNAGRLTSCDLSTGEFEVLFEDPGFDLDLVCLHPITKIPQAVGRDRHRLTWEVLDKSIAKDFEALRQDGSADFIISSRDDEDTKWIVTRLSASAPIDFSLYDRQSGKESLLWSSYEGLKQYQLADVEPFSLVARDGLTLNGYITFPPSTARAALPTVLFPHGGPWERDFWLFNHMVQFLANRGYAVLQVNFRGSTGYGKDFINAGNREWGGKMHDDLIDTVNWSVEQGFSDPERLAIFGGSYGGYAALVGATFTPDVFRCAIDLFGWSDLVSSMKTLPDDWKPRLAQWYRRVGDPYTEAEFLWSRSPMSRIDDVRIPILIGQGDNDVRVRHEASEKLVAALEERGVPYEYVILEGEGHFIANPKNWIKFFEAVERFLGQHL